MLWDVLVICDIGVAKYLSNIIIRQKNSNKDKINGLNVWKTKNHTEKIRHYNNKTDSQDKVHNLLIFCTKLLVHTF